jgi:hypothetical protein
LAPGGGPVQSESCRGDSNGASQTSHFLFAFRPNSARRRMASRAVFPVPL